MADFRVLRPYPHSSFLLCENNVNREYKDSKVINKVYDYVITQLPFNYVLPGLFVEIVYRLLQVHVDTVP